MKKQGILIGVALLIVFAIFSGTNVSPTEEGFKISNSGDYRGIDSLPLITGFNWRIPFFTSIIKIPTTMQHVVWSETATEGSTVDQAIVINCMGGSGFKVDVGLNYRVWAGKGSKVYLKYKTDDLSQITDTYLRNIVRGAMQDVSGHITVDSMLNNLPAYESSVRLSLFAKFKSEGFSLEGFNIISQPKPVDPLLAAAINKKIIAKQDAETAKMQLQITIANNNKRIADAKADSITVVARAGGDAKAYELQQRNLTPMIIEKMRIEAWEKGGSQVPTTVLGSNQQMIYSPK